MLKRITAGVCAAALSLVCVGPAAAFDCIVAKKPPSAGAAYSVDVVTGQVTPLKKNPGTEEKPHGSFTQINVNGQTAGSTFARAPEGVLPPAREGGSQYNCDGKGIDAFETCGP